MSYNIVLSFTALLADERKIAGAGFFFTVFAASLFTYRIAGRRLADRRGRWAVILPGYLAMGAGMFAEIFAHGFPLLALAGMRTGIGFGAAQPALLALTVDLVPFERRGTAMAAFYVAWEIGAATSSIVLGGIAQVLTYGGMFATSGTLLLGTVAFLTVWSRRPPAVS
jgi:MFS family permease